MTEFNDSSDPDSGSRLPSSVQRLRTHPESSKQEMTVLVQLLRDLHVYHPSYTEGSEYPRDTVARDLGFTDYRHMMKEARSLDAYGLRSMVVHASKLKKLYLAIRATERNQEKED